MLHLAEYKRRQAAPGVKVTLRNFGRDRRYPIVNRFRDSGAPLPEPDRSLLKDGQAAAKSEAFDYRSRPRPKETSITRAGEETMYKASAGVTLPTSIIGSLPRPYWYNAVLGTQELPRSHGQLALPRAVRGRGLVLPAGAGDRRPRHLSPTAMRITTRKSAA